MTKFRNVKHDAAYLFLAIAVILIAVLLCYSSLIARNPQGNFTHMIKWDTVDFVYPMATFVSDSIRTSIFPLWDPYTYGGKPCASNPQAYLFHPVNALFILLKGYSLELLQIQIILTFFIAGLSMYFCLRVFFLSQTASLIGAISFLGCGFFVGNAEHFAHINVLAFLPLSLAAMNRLLNKPGLRNLSLGALTIPLLAFCGYPTMLVFSLYMLFTFGALKIFFIDGKTQKGIIVKKVIYLFEFFILGLCASSILLIPAFENAALSVRGAGAPLESIKANSLPFGYLSTMWYPFVALKNFLPAYTEITLRNCTIGIVGLFFAIYYLLFNKTRLKWSLSFLLLISLAMTLGANTPIYTPMLKIIPFVKHVRHPALDFRAFFLFFLCIFAGFGAQEMLQHKEKSLRRGFIAFIVFLLAAFAMYYYIKAAFNFDITALVGKEHPFLLLSVFFLLAVILFPPDLPKKYLSIALIAFCIIDISHWAKVNFFTVADPVENARWAGIKEMESARNRRVDRNAVFKRKSGQYPISLEDNFSMFFKYFTDTGYDPMILKHYDEFFKSPNNAVITEDFRIAPIYETNIMPDEKSVLSAIKNQSDLHKTAFINEKEIKDRDLLRKLRNLSAQKDNAFSAKIIHYSPNSIYYDVKTETPVLVFFNEIYYPGWRLFSDGAKLPLFRINHAFRGAYLEPGEYRLKMLFSPASFKIGLGISISGFLFIFFSIFAPVITKKSKSTPPPTLG